MTKKITGVVLGAVVYFGWGMVSWMVLPWHNNMMRAIPEETLITDVLRTVVEEPGFYTFPNRLHNGEPLAAVDWTAKYVKGPSGVLIYSPGGNNPMSPWSFLVAIVTALFISSLSFLVLILSRDRVRTIVGRAGLTAVLGGVAAVATHVPYWNWFHFPANVTLVLSLDLLVGFFMLGFLQSFFIPTAEAHGRL